jgi:ribonucleotide reductase beta subunit family protein with ferritin-like domain
MGRYKKKAQKASIIWTAEEIDLAVDHSHYQELSAGASNTSSHHALAFFMISSMSMVGISFSTLASAPVQSPGTRCLYGLQIAIENVHAETYGRLLSLL